MIDLQPSKPKPLVKELQTLREMLNERLSQVCDAPRGAKYAAKAALRYSILTEGHRWRPLLFLVLLKAMQQQPEKFLDVAAGIELIHSGTLIIDDLPFIDNATMRRGRDCCHVKFGIDVAVYASHLAFDLAETLILESVPHDQAKHVFIAIKQLKGTLVEGQCLERALLNKTVRLSKENIEKQYYLKSGALFDFAATLAAILSNKGKRDTNLVRTFAGEAGVAYQIADDIADISGKTEEIGKFINMDSGKTNYPRLFGKQYAIIQLEHHREHSLSTMHSAYAAGILTGTRRHIQFILNQLHQHY